MDGAAGTAATSSDDPLAFSRAFAKTGMPTVEIAVWNCDMAETEAVTGAVDILVSPYYVYLPVVLRNH